MTPASSLHVAIIMDGNGRWATARGLPRTAGHHRGVEVVREIVRGAAPLGIDTLTLYAFSADNWGRPSREVSTLMQLFGEFLREQAAACAAEGVRVSVIGRRDRLEAPLVSGIALIEAVTAGGRAIHVRLAIDYSAREALWQAARRAPRDRGHFARLVASGRGTCAEAPDVDLLIRTGGEQRLSDFLLWEAAYAELYFTATMWPDFTAGQLEAAIAAFRTRDRRFGRLSDTNVGPDPGVPAPEVSGTAAAQSR
jgi:undecaprenyl diphosphate synthase